MFVLCADHGYFGASNLPHLPWVIMAKLGRPATTAWNLLGYRTKLKVYGWKKGPNITSHKVNPIYHQSPKGFNLRLTSQPNHQNSPGAHLISSRRSRECWPWPTQCFEQCVYYIYIYYVYIYMILYYIWYCIWYCIWYYILGMGTMMCIYIIKYVCIYHVMISCHMLKGRPVKSSGICLTWGVEVETHHS
jgi:hypothetical protein